MKGKRRRKGKERVEVGNTRRRMFLICVYMMKRGINNEIDVE